MYVERDQGLLKESLSLRPRKEEQLLPILLFISAAAVRSCWDIEKEGSIRIDNMRGKEKQGKRTIRSGVPPTLEEFSRLLPVPAQAHKSRSGSRQCQNPRSGSKCQSVDNSPLFLGAIICSQKDVGGCHGLLWR